MNSFGQRAMRWWKMWRPHAYDALADPVAYFAASGIAHERHVDEQVRFRAAQGWVSAGGDPEVERRHAAEDVEYLLPLADRELGLDDLMERASLSHLVIDPRRIHLTQEGLPAYDHPVLQALDDPSVAAAEFHEHWVEWLRTVPAEPAVRSVGRAPDPDLALAELESIDLTGYGAMLRRCDGRELIRTPSFNFVLPDPDSSWAFSAGLLRESFEVIEFVQERPWATSATLEQWWPALILPRVIDDGSVADRATMREFTHEVGDLHQDQYAVVGGQPKVIDWPAVAWSTFGEAPRARTAGVKPLLLIDIDGCLSPYGTGHGDGFVTPLVKVMVHRERARRLLSLADRYELAWATTWEDAANGLGEALGWPELPVIRVASAMNYLAGYECGKIPEIIRYVDGRPFAWFDDQVTRTDATKLLREHDCLVLRTDPNRGIEEHHLDQLHAWSNPD
ncbi:hypothetical protein CGZ98_05250 [Enemella evansiae]|uniref:hypothetical protein n=1 Tax=Enemella evansiae TaxID=2016499 RepID=UPI000B97908A|nr:hypothetical protein [Enemella evansiae]OYO13831.1 hypothetical protein CGZ98_05250 [Enemella evansiae]